MLKKNFKYLIYIFIIMIFGLFIVEAESTPEVRVVVNGDLVAISPTYAPSAIYYNTKNDKNTMKLIENIGGSTLNGRGYVSLKNGSYYFFVPSTNAIIDNNNMKGPVVVNQSCKNDSTITGIKGTRTIERCFIKTNNETKMDPDASSTLATCASGYKITEKKYITDMCSGMKLTNGLTQRYCNVVISVTCSPSQTTVPAPSLSSLSVSSGNLNPSFNSSTKNYKVSVSSDVSSIKVNASPSSGSTIVSGTGTKNLNYGANTIKVKVQNAAGNSDTYTIVVTRDDNRSNVNTLSNLTVSEGTLTPSFSSNVTNYTVNVSNEVSSIKIDATLTDRTSSFAKDAGPNTYSLKEGTNIISIKVVSQKGNTNAYNITVIRNTNPTRCTTEANTIALLKGIDLSTDISNIDIPQIDDFMPNIFVYDDIRVPYQVSNLKVNAYVNEEGDTVTVSGGEDLEVNVPKSVIITVKSKACSGVTREYTLNVVRQPEKVLGSNPDLENILIEGHDEFNFEYSKSDYSLTLKKDETSLNITLEKVEEETECGISGNEDLKYGSSIEIKCTSEDGEHISEYTIAIDGVEKGSNTFLIVILVIIIIIILIYLILRLLGYKIYFNFSAIGAFFRGIGEK